MARAEKKARYAGLPPLTGAAHTTQVLAGRFVRITGDKTTGGTGGAYPIAHCGAGQRAFGVAELDSADPTSDQFPDHSRDLLVPVARRGGGSISRVLTGEALSAGDLVQSGAAGVAVKHSDHATVGTGVELDDNAITWTARDPEKTGLTVTIVDSASNGVSLSVDVDGDDIVVTSATDGASAMTSTATEVMAAIAEHDTASQLVTVASTGASDGSGVVAAAAETALVGGGIALGVACADAGNGDYAEIDLF